MSPQKRIGVLVVAYNAESTLRGVLKRIPAPIWDKIEQVFVFDDASQDNTHEVGKALLEQEPFAGKLRVFRNPLRVKLDPASARLGPPARTCCRPRRYTLAPCAPPVEG